MKQTLKGIAYIHHENIVHRDLKPENIVIEMQDNLPFVKIIDFGFAKSFKNGQTFKEKLGSPMFIAPEVLSDKPYTEKCDIWSIGVISYYILCGFEPFFSTNQQELYQKIKSASYTYNENFWD